jgi:hypothetical protein
LEVGALSAYVALKPIISAIGKIVDGMSAIGGAVGTLTGKGATAVGGAMGVDPATAKASGDQIGQQALFGFAGPIAQMSNLVGQMAGDFANAKALALAQQSGVQIGQATVAGMREGVGAHSPSVEAMRIGMNVGEGLGMGMEQSTAPAHAARTISSNALGGLQGGAALGGAGAQGGDTNTIGPIHISITAPEGVTDAQAISVSALSTVLERYQISSGR